MVVRKSRTSINKALFDACVENNARKVASLVESGADIHARDKHMRTPLIASIEKGNLEIARYLLEHGADPNDAVCRYGTPSNPCPTGAIIVNALTLALDSPEMVKLLIDCGANAGVVTEEGHTALITLMSKRIKPDGKGNIALDEDKTQDHLKVAEILLKNGTDVNRKESYEGNTALIMAVDNDDVEMIKLLLKYGADITITNKKGGDVALKYRSKIVYQLLKEAYLKLSEGRKRGFDDIDEWVRAEVYLNPFPIGRNKKNFKDLSRDKDRNTDKETKDKI